MRGGEGRGGEERENDIGGEGRGEERREKMTLEGRGGEGRENEKGGKWGEGRGGEGRIRKMHAGRGDIWLEGVSNLGNHYGLKERRGK